MSAFEAPRRPRTPARDTSASWPLADRIGLALCWAAGITLILVAGAIVLFFAYKGITELQPSLLYERPTGDPDQSKAGGFLDPIVGTLMLTAIGTIIAVPIAVAVAIWLVEYGRPAPLARVVESGVEIIAGTPSIVLALFGLTVFSNTAFAFLSQSPEGTGAFGRSILISGVVMSIVALPLIVGATREALNTVPAHVREASYALGKSKAATVRRVLLPSIRPGIATGTALGMGRIIGDTAIVVILAGATLQLEGSGSGIPFLQTLQGTGATLTTYVYENSPAGEGNAPEKAYAAAAVLLVLVVLMNYVAARIARGGREVQQWSR
ncbi:MAG: phosphate ABC transporter permease PstA [Solirubrobacterales bacterium]|nr:phosphate ABC transporter permease PstA [Solirubrobacterales bacterium]